MKAALDLMPLGFIQRLERALYANELLRSVVPPPALRLAMLRVPVGLSVAAAIIAWRGGDGERVGRNGCQNRKQYTASELRM
jgi:hypothetical protein